MSCLGYRVPGILFIKICDRHHQFEMIGIHTKVSFYKSLHLCGRFARKICCLFLPESYEILLMSQHFCWGVSFSCTCSSTFFCFMWNENGNTSWLKYFLQTYWRFVMAAMTPYVLRSWSIYHALRIQSPCQMMIGVYNHILRKVFWFHYHSQKVIGSLGMIKSWNFLLPNFCLGSFLTWMMSWLSGRATRESAPRSGTGRQKISSLKLTICHWKRMVGRRSFPVGMAYFEGQTASFRECNCVECVFWETSLCVVCRCAYKLSQSAPNGNWNIHLY